MTTLRLKVGLTLEGFSLDIDDELSLAGITVLFGPSGSGKTTLLRIIAGLEPAARGHVEFAGECWQDSAGSFVTAHRREVGMVFQDARLFPHLSVAGNLAYADKRSQHVDTAVSRQQVVEALDLGALLGRRPRSLSGGERQRVAIARAVLSRPRVMLMDEPLGALDLKRKAEILPLIERLPDAFGIPVVYVTHSIEEVARLADRLFVLSEGRKVAAGPMQEVLE